jgi:hypothetical protein
MVSSPKLFQSFAATSPGHVPHRVRQLYNRFYAVPTPTCASLQHSISEFFSESMRDAASCYAKKHALILGKGYRAEKDGRLQKLRAAFRLYRSSHAGKAAAKRHKQAFIARHGLAEVHRRQREAKARWKQKFIRKHGLAEWQKRHGGSTSKSFRTRYIEKHGLEAWRLRSANCVKARRKRMIDTLGYTEWRRRENQWVAESRARKKHKGTPGL